VVTVGVAAFVAERANWREGHIKDGQSQLALKKEAVSVRTDAVIRELTGQ
jgi:hypothetical protein